MKPSNDTSTHGEQLCKFILKSIKNGRSYGLDENLTFKYDLDLGPTRTNVSNVTSTCDGEQLCQIILKSIHNCRSYGPDKFGWTDGCTEACTHGHMHTRTLIHQTVVITTMSRSSQAGSTKIRHTDTLTKGHPMNKGELGPVL